MLFASSGSNDPNPARALDDALRRVSRKLSAPPHLAIALVASRFAAHVEYLAADLAGRVAVGGTSLLLCADQAFEGIHPAGVAVMAASTDGALAPIRLGVDDRGDRVDVAGWNPPAGSETALLFADALTFPSAAFLDAIGDGPVVAGASPDSVPLLIALNGRVFRDGAVGVALAGDHSVSVLHAEDMRPVGDPMVVTEASGTQVLGLGGEAAMSRLQSQLEVLPGWERRLASEGVGLGLAVDEYGDDIATGGFLVSRVLGADLESDSLSVEEPVPVGTLVQFHVADPRAMEDSLRAVLSDETDADAVLVFGDRRTVRAWDAVALLERFLRPQAMVGMAVRGIILPIGRRSRVGRSSLAAMALRGS